MTDVCQTQKKVISPYLLSHPVEQDIQLSLSMHQEYYIITFQLTLTYSSILRCTNFLLEFEPQRLKSKQSLGIFYPHTFQLLPSKSQNNHYVKQIFCTLDFVFLFTTMLVGGLQLIQFPQELPEKPGSASGWCKEGG